MFSYSGKITPKYTPSKTFLAFVCISVSSSLIGGQIEEKVVTADARDGEEIERVKQIPFHFSITNLLPTCQQVEIILPTYRLMGK